MAPTAAGRGWTFDWLDRGSAIPRVPAPGHGGRWIEDFRSALRRVQEGAGTVLVTGSFHTVGDAMQELGLDP